MYSRWWLRIVGGGSFKLRIVGSGSFCFMSWGLNYFVLLAPYVCFHIFS